MNKALIFDSEKFDETSLLQKVKHITQNPLLELDHAKDLELFSQIIIYNGNYQMIIINFQMVGFIDLKGEQLEKFVSDIKRSQKDIKYFIGVTSWDNQVSTLRRLGLAITHKDYNGIQTDVQWKANKVLTKEEIGDVVCKYYKISFEKMLSVNRKREVVKARQISMYLCKLFTTDSLKAIGDFFGGRHHTSVMHSCQTVKDLMDTEKLYKGEVLILQESVEQLKR